MRIVCADGEPQYYELLDAERIAAAGHELVWHDAVAGDDELWVERLRGADALALLWRLPPGVLRRSPSIRVVSFAGTGVETYVEMEEARERGIVVCNVPRYGTNAVAEHTVALMLAVARRVPAGDRFVRQGGWGQQPGRELAGKRLGVVGAGPIAARVVELGSALGMSVAAWTRSPSPERERALGAPFVSLEHLFSSSDVVTIHVAGTVRGLVGADLLALLPQDAILVNTARSAIVDEAALARLLDEGRLFGAGVDVFDPEPPPADHPLLRSERVVVTPHVGYHTPEASRELVRVWIENLLAFARGEPQNVRP